MRVIAIVVATALFIGTNFLVVYQAERYHEQTISNLCDASRLLANATLQPLKPIKNPDPVSLAQNVNANRQKAHRLAVVKTALQKVAPCG